MPSSANLIGSLLFGGIGFAAFLYGKKTSNLKCLLIGVVLMGYTYFISNTTAIYPPSQKTPGLPLG